MVKLRLAAPSSSGPGRLAFIQEIAGSIPAGVTKHHSYSLKLRELIYIKASPLLNKISEVCV